LAIAVLATTAGACASSHVDDPFEELARFELGELQDEALTARAAGDFCLLGSTYGEVGDVLSPLAPWQRAVACFDERGLTAFRPLGPLGATPWPLRRMARYSGTDLFLVVDDPTTGAGRALRLDARLEIVAEAPVRVDGVPFVPHECAANERYFAMIGMSPPTLLVLSAVDLSVVTTISDAGIAAWGGLAIDSEDRVYYGRSTGRLATLAVVALPSGAPTPVTLPELIPVDYGTHVFSTPEGPMFQWPEALYSSRLGRRVDGGWTTFPVRFEIAGLVDTVWTGDRVLFVDAGGGDYTRQAIHVYRPSDGLDVGRIEPALRWPGAIPTPIAVHEGRAAYVDGEALVVARVR